MGIALFRDITIGEVYSYRIIQVGHEKFNDVFLLNSDTTIQAELTPATGYARDIDPEIQIYPNPVREDLFIESTFNIDYVELVSIYGNWGKTVKMHGHTPMLDISDLCQGVYLMIINPVGAVPLIRRIIILKSPE